MAKVYNRGNEDVESLLRRFKRKVNDEMILADLKKHEEYKSPSQKKREKRKEAEIRRRKLERIQNSRLARFEERKPVYRPRQSQEGNTQC